MNLRIYFYTAFILFLLSSIVLWLYIDPLFDWLYGYDSARLSINPALFAESVAKTAKAKQLFFFFSMLMTIVCFIVSILVIRRESQSLVRALAHVAVTISGIAIVLYIFLTLAMGMVSGGGMIGRRQLFVCPPDLAFNPDLYLADIGI